MNAAHSKRLMRGAWILSVAGLIAKLLSAVYRVPYQNLVGNTGFYVYQQIYPLYGIIMTMALTAGPVFVAKVAVTTPELVTRQRTLKRLAGVLAIWGGVVFIGSFAGAGIIASWMGDARLAPLVRVVGCMGLTLPLLAMGRGYFQAQYSMTETAWSQVVEQVVRVGVILTVAVIAVHASWSHYLTGTWAMTGGVLGALAAAAVLAISWLRRRAKRPRLTDFGAGQARTQVPSWSHLMWQTFSEGGALVLYAAILLILQLVDSFTVAKSLVESGMTMSAAENLKGIYDRGQPMVQLGLVVATALTQSLLPPLSGAHQQHADHTFARTGTVLVHLSVAVSLLATVGLCAEMPLLNRGLFGDTDGTLVLQVYMLIIAVTAAINACASILQSQDLVRVPTIAILAGVLVKALVNSYFVHHWQTAGASWATVLGLGVTMMVIYLALDPLIRRRIWSGGFGWRLLVVAAGMGAVVWTGVTLTGTVGRVSAVIWAILWAIVGLIVAVALAAWTGLFTRREVLALPVGARILRMTKHLRKGE